MAGFEVKIVKIDDVIDHPNADRLSLVKIAGYSVVSGKLEDGSHRYKAGDLVAYVPENAVVPEYLLKKGYWNDNENKGMLAGKNGDRVKPIKLRGVISEGIMFPVTDHVEPTGNVLKAIDGPMRYVDGIGEVKSKKIVEEGDEVSEYLGITKYEPEIPATMAGDVIGRIDLPVKYDIENIKKYDRVFDVGDDVYMTEKLHGTQAQFGWLPNGNDPELIEGQFFAASKGIASQGLVFKDTEQNRTANLYVKTLISMIDKIKMLKDFASETSKVVLFGEIFGKGIQDLGYNEDKPTFRVFDIWMDGSFLDFNDLMRICDYAEIPMVPILYVGQFTWEDLKRETAGKSKLGGTHIREGVVVKPLKERTNEWIGRVILKSISDEYLGRKNGTEYN